jgi:hypothetical protein
MLIAAPCRATLLIASCVGPAVPLLQKQGFFPPKSRASNRQWAAWVLATRLGSYCAIMFFHQSAVKKTFDEREARAGHGPD